MPLFEHVTLIQMLPEPERNIGVFSSDAERLGGYAYTAAGGWSARTANAKQSEELYGMIRRHFPGALSISDIGSGDGTYTLEMAQTLKPILVRGVEPAPSGVEAARKNNSEPNVTYEVGSIYDVENRFRHEPGTSLAVVRGVLHHLDNPQAAIKRLADQFDHVIVLEPNGYNPVMKVIEKMSKYHIEHDEKSYWPPMLNAWFRDGGMAVAEQRFFCLVPYFCPTVAAKILKALEPVVESLPGIRHIACGTNLILYRKNVA